MRYANFDIPDLPIRAFQKVGGRIRPQGGGKGSSPDVPDYEALARQEAQSNLDLAKYATQANRVNQITPYGSVNWTNDRVFDQAGYDRAMKAYRQGLASQASAPSGGPGGYVTVYDGSGSDQDSGRRVWIGGGNPINNAAGAQRIGVGGSALQPPNPEDFYSGGDQWTQTMAFSPEVQGVYDRAIRGLEQQYGDALAAYDPETATNMATDLILSRLNPELDRQGETLRTQLTNQGIVPGSAAWNRAMSQFGQQRNDAVTQAQLQGIGLGMNQQAQAFNQASYLRGLPLNELNTLLGGGQLQAASFPGYAQQATTGGANLLGAAQAGYGAELGAHNAEQAQRGRTMSGLSGIGGAVGTAFGGPIGGLIGSVGGGLLGGLFG